VLGPASSQLKIPEPVPDNWEQGLESADDSMDSDNGEYEGQSQETPESQKGQESQEENELEQRGDDEDLFADWGGHQGRSCMRSVTRKL